jgi:hypothetical protein
MIVLILQKTIVVSINIFFQTHDEKSILLAIQDVSVRRLSIEFQNKEKKNSKSYLRYRGKHRKS